MKTTNRSGGLWAQKQREYNDAPPVVNPSKIPVHQQKYERITLAKYIKGIQNGTIEQRLTKKELKNILDILKRFSGRPEAPRLLREYQKRVAYLASKEIYLA